MGVVPHHTLAG